MRDIAMRVMALPAFCNRHLNPYNALLYSAVHDLGAAVIDASPSAVLGRDYDVVHIHWPEYLFDAPGLGRALAKSLGTMLVVSTFGLRKVSVVWTVHNLAGHDQWHPRLAKTMWRWFVRRVDGYIALSQSARDEALRRFPELQHRPGFVIPHGHYRGEYPDTVSRETARHILGIPATAPTIAFLGTIRPYKNVTSLSSAFTAVQRPNWRLLIAGEPATDDLRDEIERSAANDPRVRLRLQFVPAERVQVYLRAADLLVFPYRDIMNSGSALLALSFERPILVPDLGAMAELRDTVGEEWVRTYQGTLSAQTLIDAMAWATTTSRDTGKLLNQLEWSLIGRQTIEAYQFVTAQRRSRETIRHAAIR